MTPITNVKQFIIEEFLPDSDASQLDDDLDLIAAGIIDSLGVLKLIAAIEDGLKVSIEPEEMDPQHYSSVRAIEALIRRKTEAKTAAA